MARRFNTTGPCRPEWHYMVPAVPRLPEIKHHIEKSDYFVVHAPRQTGKTTTLIETAKELTASGNYVALHFSCEAGEAAQDDYEAAELMVIEAIRHKADLNLPQDLQPPPMPQVAAGKRLGHLLSAWARACPRPLVLFFDEIDALRGQSLLSVLRQLRDGFLDRPKGYPASIVLCGLRDVRDYKAAAGGGSKDASAADTKLGTASPFNIKVASMKLGNFDKNAVENLYLQHTAETGQVFAPEAIERAFELTQGQPWLVNALGYEITETMRVPITETITVGHIEQAKERLILARATHIDSLVSKLREDRVKRILEPVLAGQMLMLDAAYDDDALYLRDMGLIARTNPIAIANDIYKEVIVRVLTGMPEANIVIEPHSFILPDGRLNMQRLLDEFTEFWCQHGDILANHLTYHEAAPQLVFMAFLQRVVNGGGFIDREYGIGRGRIDLLVRWPFKDAQGIRAVQREAIEMKVWRDKAKDPLAEGLKQIDQYLVKTNLDTGVLIIFDRRKNAKAIEKRVKFKAEKTPMGKKITLLRA
ncbi:MAG TPA: ATP-binding protein [Polyangium sp.]|nr:ATP-binding protein [Polyangium sp.]HRI63959.1 ATP-binding protein [Polyangium sp.]